MSTHHAAVWLDHNEARIFHIHPESFEEETIQSPHAHIRLHPHAGSDSGHRAAEDQAYYHDVFTALKDAEEILIVGPGKAKLELIKHAHKHDPVLAPRIIGVETVDHPTDRQIAAYVRQYFKVVDNTR